MTPNDTRSSNMSRRSFLADAGMGFTGLALSAMLFKDDVARGADNPAPDGRPHHEPKAKSVIWIFAAGGVSHIESFDPKPELNRFTGKRLSATPHADAIPVKYHRHNVGNMQIGSRKYGKSGLEVADWWPHIGSCADDIAVVRSLWIDDNDHGAQLTWHHGRPAREGGTHPSLGAWVNYGLGTMNKNLPEFVVLGGSISECCGGVWVHGGGYLGPTQAGVRFNGRTGVPYLTPREPRQRQEQELETKLLGRLNSLAAVEYPDDPILRARIQSYELAFAMQSSVPEAMGLATENAATRRMYGLEEPKTSNIGSLCLMARRLVERGVRFVQVHLPLGWDAHNDLVGNHAPNAFACDQPIAALVKDLKQRDMLKDTLVVWATDFGRAPYNTNGRDHWPDGFSCWLAGGGLKGGVVHGATDPFGFSPVTPPHYITDIHATVLHQLGLDSRRLTVPGRIRFERDFGMPIREIIA